ncbi:MAG: hypothetical protein V4813_18095 [Gemmatimonadota bacterium]
MRLPRPFVLFALLLATACGTDESVGVGGVAPPIDGRLVASLETPVIAAGDQDVDFIMTVRSSLPEEASGGVCAQVVEARPANSLSWSDVTSTTSACIALVVVVAPSSTAQFTGVASLARLRQVGGGVSGAPLRVRVRHTLAGARGVYAVQSAELGWSVP